MKEIKLTGGFANSVEIDTQPVGKPFPEANLAIWTSGCEMAEKLVAELERLRMENLELRREDKKDVR